MRTLLTMLPQNNLASLPLFDFTDSTEPLDPAGCPKLIVKAVADADSLVELHAEYGKGIYTFLGTMAGATTAFVTTSKENALDSDACDKAARFVKICDAYNLSLIHIFQRNVDRFFMTDTVLPNAADVVKIIDISAVRKNLLVLINRINVKKENAAGRQEQAYSGDRAGKRVIVGDVILSLIHILSTGDHAPTVSAAKPL